MAKGQSNTHTDILRYALPHLEQERDRIQAQIDHIHRQLGQRVSAPASTAQSTGAGSAEAPAKKRVLSAAARKRIAAAQKKRWAEHRKAQAQTKGKPGKGE